MSYRISVFECLIGAFIVFFSLIRFIILVMFLFHAKSLYFRER